MKPMARKNRYQQFLFDSVCCPKVQRRVRQKPVELLQLDMFDEVYERRMLYVRSQQEETQDVSAQESKSVQRSSTVDSSDECSPASNAWWI